MKRKNIYIERIPGFFASIYEKATRLVIDSYYRQVADEVVSHLKSGSILDLGTGPGYFPIEIVRRNPCIRIDGVDSGHKLIKIARANAFQAGVDGQLNFETGNAAKLRFRDSSYDMIISTGMLHMLKNPVEMLRECFRILKPGGEAWIFDPAEVTSRMDIKKYKASLSPWEKFVFKIFTLMAGVSPPRTYNREQIVDMIAATDFKEYSIEEKDKVIKARLKKTEAS